MSFNIRKAIAKDAQAIHNLIVELAVFEKEPTAVEVSVNDLVRDGFSNNPKFNTFVAEKSNGTIIGMALFYERYSTWKGKTIHLEDLMVTKSERGIGAGKALYTAVLKYAHKNNFKRVAWEVIDWNTNAINFYKNTGATILSNWSVCQMNEQNLNTFVNN